MRMILATLLFVFTIACTQQETGILKSEEFLVGNWSNIEYGDSTFTVEKVSTLNENEYGLSFKSDLSFLEHKNSGWCGTPPISYADFDGSWSVNDSVISISVAYWGGMANYQWKIISLKNSKLELWVINQDYQMEE